MIKSKKSVAECVKQVEQMKANGQFENYIEYMQFPFYKNLCRDTRINFEFPLTVLVGRNGSGKSSTLHALYGAVRGKTCAEFWFSTELDPIDENAEGDRNRYFYGYREDGKHDIKEVLKLRMKRGSSTKEDDPDYWETAKPQKTSGMVALSRNQPVDKNVVYIDFRAELSAFDKEYHFVKKPLKERKQRLRDRAKYLSRLFHGEEMRIPGRNGNKRARLISLPKEYIDNINFILEKKYTEILLAVDHDVYRDIIGTSVFLKTEWQNTYSEANAGSGEIAVIQLVRKVLDAEKHSLILLDEPEVSLHPSAQKRLQRFLLESIKQQQLQVVISTHSPILIEGMPNSAIKLYRTASNGRFEILESISYQEAFFDIGNVVQNMKIILCEDISAKNMIEKTLLQMGKQPFFSVKFYPGGAGTLLSKYLPVYAADESFKNRIFFILDGDQKKDFHVEWQNLTIKQQADPEYLKKCLDSSLGVKNMSMAVDGNDGQADIKQKCEFLMKCLKFSQNVFYLPTDGIPESVVLESKYAKDNFGTILEQYGPITKENAKEVIQQIAAEDMGDKNQVDATMMRLAHHWAGEDSIEKLELVEVLQTIFDIA